MQSAYKILPKGVLWTNLLPANETFLLNDMYLILLYATRTPPHLLVSVNGKIFTLTVNGASVDGELAGLLALIRKKNIATIFICLNTPGFFTTEQLRKEIRSSMLAYPRADIGIATCLTPIKDFCRSILNIADKNVNLIFDLLKKLQEHNDIKDCYCLNLENHLTPAGGDFLTLADPPLVEKSQPMPNQGGTFLLKIYQMNDVYEAIRNSLPGL